MIVCVPVSMHFHVVRRYMSAFLWLRLGLDKGLYFKVLVLLICVVCCYSEVLRQLT